MLRVLGVQGKFSWSLYRHCLQLPSPGVPRKWQLTGQLVSLLWHKMDRISLFDPLPGLLELQLNIKTEKLLLACTFVIFHDQPGQTF